LNASQRGGLMTSDLWDQVQHVDPWQQHRAYFSQVSDADFLHQMLYLDTKAFMVSLNLTYNDKMSMAASVEVRVPFLDRELVEFAAWHIPPHLKMKGHWQPTTKYIFREAMRGMVPDEVLRQPKAGFGAPVDSWVRQDLQEMIGDLLAESRVRSRGFFNPQFVQQLLAEHRRGEQDWSMQIWQLLSFELWQQTFIDPSHREANNNLALSQVTAA
jgi:asparagine synthase (glutamine-hydrolysing)